MKAIVTSLRAGSIRLNKFTVEFRLDVFRAIFGAEKTEFYKKDFPPELFPEHWHIIYSHIGDGCQVKFPIYVRARLKWARQTYMKCADGTMMPKPKTFTEIIHVTLNKIRCS